MAKTKSKAKLVSELKRAAIKSIIDNIKCIKRDNLSLKYSF